MVPRSVVRVTGGPPVDAGWRAGEAAGVTPPVVTDLLALLAEQGDAAYREFLRGPALSLGLFTAGAGHADVQDPHAQDEVYVVLEGSAVLALDGVDRPLQPGSVAYVPRGVPHHFHTVSDGLRALVVFAPAPD